jgi:antagonist of KipI
VPPILWSRSTYLPGGFGGFEGRRLKAGDRLPLGPEPVPPRIVFGAGDVEAGGSGDVTLRVTRGPQWDRFDDAARQLFFTSQFTVTAASDRMGYRLSGPAMVPSSAATLPSEAACPGAIQIPDDGQPIVLMPDGPTVGGYPKLAVVARADLRVLAQCQPGRGVRFREVELEVARATQAEDKVGLQVLQEQARRGARHA